MLITIRVVMPGNVVTGGYKVVVVDDVRVVVVVKVRVDVDVDVDVVVVVVTVLVVVTVVETVLVVPTSSACAGTASARLGIGSTEMRPLRPFMSMTSSNPGR